MPDSHAYGHRNRYGYTDSDTYADFNAYSDSCSYGYSHAYGGNANTDANVRAGQLPHTHRARRLGKPAEHAQNPVTGRIGRYPG